MSVSRRSFVNTVPVMLAPGLWTTARAQAPSATAAPAAPHPSFPTQPPELAREMVGVAHNNLARVKELLALHPTLALASWDWGFGDWEDALGAASHMGNRPIAEALLASGARPTIHSAAMLGQLDVVKAFVAASPGVEATPGPHGITLLRHALAGGPAAQAVADYLRTLPGADARPNSVPITSEEMTALAGDYRYGARTDERIEVKISSNNSLVFTRSGGSGRNLVHVGDRAFFPAGAPRVRIVFTAQATGMTLTVYDPNVVLEARRT